MAKKIDWSKIRDKMIDGEKKKSSFPVDERIYTPKLKEDGSAQVVIRFLPSPDTDIPYVKKYSHGFSGVGGWYIEDCPTTIGRDCPVCEENNVAWNGGNKDAARIRARRTSFYVNILIVKDPQTPENEGKVFIFRYGVKIHEKIMGKINPPEDGIDEPVMVFDPEEGANFKLMIKQVKIKTPQGDKLVSNYDSSQFSEKSKLASTEKAIDKILNSCYPLSKEVAEENFKSYDLLSEKLNKVIKKSSSTTKSQPSSNHESNDSHAEISEESPVSTEESSDVPMDESNEDEFFKKLRNK